MALKGASALQKTTKARNLPTLNLTVCLISPPVDSKRPRDTRDTTQITHSEIIVPQRINPRSAQRICTPNFGLMADCALRFSARLFD